MQLTILLYLIKSKSKNNQKIFTIRREIFHSHRSLPQATAHAIRDRVATTMKVKIRVTIKQSIVWTPRHLTATIRTGTYLHTGLHTDLYKDLHTELHMNNTKIHMNTRCTLVLCCSYKQLLNCLLPACMQCLHKTCITVA